MQVQAMTIRLPADLYERLRREAFEQRVSMTALIVRALDKDLGKDRE